MTYDDDCGAPAWELIEERWVKARRPHPCDGACTTGIRVGDVYWRVAGKLDGDFTLTQTCGYCYHGRARPGTPEAKADEDAILALIEQDEAECRADHLSEATAP